MPIRELLTSHKIRFTRAELSIVRELLANYPAAGLSTIAKLARQARVSDPTVLRLVAKLGFDGFPRFQRELLREVEERMSSPLAMLPSRQTVLRKKDLYNSFLKSCVAGLAAAENLLVPADLEAALDLMMDPRNRIRFLGGRFSRFLAGIMHAHFVQLRPGTQFMAGTASDLVDGIVDLGSRDVIVAFDFRRYQVDVINYCRQAAARGARIVLFTDPWKSPITEFASVTLMSPVETISPYDTMVPAAALVEALIAALVARLTPAGRKRIKIIEESRRDFGITTDVAAERRPPARRGGRQGRNGGGA